MQEANILRSGRHRSQYTSWLAHASPRSAACVQAVGPATELGWASYPTGSWLRNLVLDRMTIRSGSPAQTEIAAGAPTWGWWRQFDLQRPLRTSARSKPSATKMLMLISVYWCDPWKSWARSRQTLAKHGRGGKILPDRHRLAGRNRAGSRPVDGTSFLWLPNTLRGRGPVAQSHPLWMRPSGGRAD